jgi:hypothetical protein
MTAMVTSNSVSVKPRRAERRGRRRASTKTEQAAPASPETQADGSGT